MTRPLRRWHLRAWVVLTALLYALLFMAIEARRPAASNPEFHWEHYR